MLTVWIVSSIYFVGIFVMYHAVWRMVRTNVGHNLEAKYSPGALKVAIIVISIFWLPALLLVVARRTAKAVEERGG